MSSGVQGRRLGGPLTWVLIAVAVGCHLAVVAVVAWPGGAPRAAPRLRGSLAPRKVWDWGGGGAELGGAGAPRVGAVPPRGHGHLRGDVMGLVFPGGHPGGRQEGREGLLHHVAVPRQVVQAQPSHEAAAPANALMPSGLQGLPLIL